MTEKEAHCSVETCEKPGKTRQLCVAHYKRYLRYGNPIFIPGVTDPSVRTTVQVAPPKTRERAREHLLGISPSTCKRPDCESESRPKGLCGRHLAQASGYSLSIATYLLLWGLHKGMCHSCKVREATQIDHDHTCCNSVDGGKTSCGRCVRGFLCGRCNRALAAARDDAHVLASAAHYLNVGSPISETTD